MIACQDAVAVDLFDDQDVLHAILDVWDAVSDAHQYGVVANVSVGSACRRAGSLCGDGGQLSSETLVRKARMQMA